MTNSWKTDKDKYEWFKKQKIISIPNCEESGCGNKTPEILGNEGEEVIMNAYRQFELEKNMAEIKRGCREYWIEKVILWLIWVTPFIFYGIVIYACHRLMPV